MPEACPNCGTSVDKADKICVKCGYKIKKLGYPAEKLEDVLIATYFSELRSIRNFSMLSAAFGGMTVVLGYLVGGVLMIAFGVFILGFVYLQTRRRKELEERLRKGEIV